VGMPGFSGQGSREFDLAAGSVYGYRWWCLNAPDLQANPFSDGADWRPRLLRGQRDQFWTPGINEARCLNQPHHVPPSDEDGCGFWAYWAPPEVPHFRSNSLWMLGVIRGFGQTFIGSEGFRCQKAIIVALHLASEFSLAPRGTRGSWRDVFSQPGIHYPPHGRPSLQAQEPAPPTADERAAGQDKMQAWQAVIEDYVSSLYPDARIMAKRRALLALHPPFRDRPVGQRTE
jgi:hypothetical protein